MHYLAIDPGQKNTGWASYNEIGETEGVGIFNDPDKFLDWLEEQNPKVVICENYKINPGVGHVWSSVPTLQIIGAIKRIVKKQGAQLVLQDNTALGVGLRYLGMHQVYRPVQGKPRKHVPDDLSALAHGEYFLVKNKIKPHRLENGQ